MTGFVEDMRALGRTPTARLLDKRIVAADETVAHHLVLAPGTEPAPFWRALPTQHWCQSHQYVIERRVERGKQMLRHTDLSILEIGLATGFADQSHFTKTFRRVAQVRPREYRIAA